MTRSEAEEVLVEFEEKEVSKPSLPRNFTPDEEFTMVHYLWGATTPPAGDVVPPSTNEGHGIGFAGAHWRTRSHQKNVSLTLVVKQ